MPKVRLLAPNVADKDGNPLGAQEQVVDVDDETAKELHARGAASLIEDEERNVQENKEHGHYGDVVGREEVGQTGAGTPHPGPQADEDEDEDDHPKNKKGKK